MDLRHYDTKAHGLEASYEDVQEGMSTPYGIARTSELMLWPSGNVPAKPATAAMAQAGAVPPMLVATPAILPRRACVRRLERARHLDAVQKIRRGRP